MTDMQVMKMLQNYGIKEIETTGFTLLLTVTQTDAALVLPIDDGIKWVLRSGQYDLCGANWDVRLYSGEDGWLSTAFGDNLPHTICYAWRNWRDKQ